MSDVSPPRESAFPSLMRQADQKYCFSCGKLMHVSAGACPSCGAAQGQGSAGEVLAPASRRMGPVAVALPADRSKFCFGCGAQIHQAAFACPACGAVQQVGHARLARKDRTVAVVLAFLLGGIGVHRFYLGSVWLGLLYLLFCWTLIPALIATVEGVIFISTSDVEFQRKYG